MSYAFSWPLQQALVAALSVDPVIAAEVGGRIFDAPPHAADLGDPPPPFVLLGEEVVDAWASAFDAGAEHTLTLSVIAGDGGFARVKRVAAAAAEVALGPLALTRGRVVLARFLDARSRLSEGGALRRIDLRLRLVIEDDPSGG